MQSHTVGTIREELCKELLLAQKLYHLCHPQYSGKAERAKGILKLKLAKFSETLSSFGQKHATSPYSHMVYSLEDTSVTL